VGAILPSPGVLAKHPVQESIVGQYPVEVGEVDVRLVPVDQRKYILNV
jgi:hypothetical protein